MTSLFFCWVAFPLVLVALSVGCGLLVRRLVRIAVPGALVPGVGLAAIIVVAQLLTVADATAELATPVVVALAVAGIGLYLPAQLGRINWWPIGAAAAVFAVFAAPVVLSGQATVLGYLRLDDTASWVALTERVMEHGRNLAGLEPSTFEATLHFYLGSDYPVGSLMPLGVGQKLVGQDAAWLYQPYLSVLAAMLALALYELAGALLQRPWARALVAFLASQPALLFGYTLWGGAKELAAAEMLPLLAALVIPAVRSTAGVRALFAPALVTAALLGVLSYAGAIWPAPLLVGALACALLWRGREIALGQVLRFAAIAVPLSFPSLLLLNFLGGTAASTITTQSRLANLIEPLSPFQVFGIWPVGDFRLRPGEGLVTGLLIAVAVVAAALGLAWAWRKRAWPVLVYVGATALASAVVYLLASAWVDAKALAIASPAVMLVAALGAAALLVAGRTAGPAVMIAALAVGVGWSNALAYQGVNLGPRHRFAELEQINHRIAGQGPTLMTGFEPYGARYFLRDGDPESASTFRHRNLPLSNGQQVRRFQTADVDRFDLDSLLIYRTLVLRRSPVASRPPAPYQLVESDRYYEVWQRPPQSQSRVLNHLGLGGALEPGAVPRCSEVLRLARAASRGKGLLAAARASPATVVSLRQSSHPPTWEPEVPGAGTLFLRDSGTLRTLARVPRDGRYGVWLRGSFRSRLEVLVDGREVGAARHELGYPGVYVPFGSLPLQAGPHEVVLRYHGADLHPGSAGEAASAGPLVLGRETANRPVSFVPPSRARSLCGQRLDWVEAVER